MPHLIPAPRPVPTREDRMTEARTFATYLDAQERDQLDARAATAEQERDEALDDRDALRVQLDAMTAAALDHRKTATEALNAKYAALGEVARLRAQLGAATDALAAIRDANERIDRALAAYDTTPGEVTEGEDQVEFGCPRLAAVLDGRVEGVHSAATCGWCAQQRNRRTQTPTAPVPSRRAQEEPARPAAAAALPSTTEEILAWLSRHGLSTTPGVGVVLAAVRRDVLGVCSACGPVTP